MVQRRHPVEEVRHQARAGVRRLRDCAARRSRRSARARRATPRSRDALIASTAPSPRRRGSSSDRRHRGGRDPVEVGLDDELATVGAGRAAEERTLEMGADDARAGCVSRLRRGDRGDPWRRTTSSGSRDERRAPRSWCPVRRAARRDASQSLPVACATSTSSMPLTWMSTNPGASTRSRTRPRVGATSTIAPLDSSTSTTPGLSVSVGVTTCAAAMAAMVRSGSRAAGRLGARTTLSSRILTQPSLRNVAMNHHAGSISGRRSASFADVGAAWWLLCRPSPAVRNASHCRFVAVLS